MTNHDDTGLRFNITGNLSGGIFIKKVTEGIAANSGLIEEEDRIAKMSKIGFGKIFYK